MPRLIWIVLLGLTLGVGIAIGYVLKPGAQSDRPSSTANEAFLNQPYTAKPNELAVFPCTRRTRFDDPFASCLLVMAGGKRLVFGAPMEQDWRGIGTIDGVFLPNGHPIAMGGLAGIRHRTWWAGRDNGLLVVGGELLTDEIAALDAAQNRSDALVSLEVDGPAGFLAANLRPKPVPGQADQFRVFDTGDLQVYAFSRVTNTGNQILSFEIRYANKTLLFQPCGGRVPLRSDARLVLPVSDRSPLVEVQRQAQISKQADLVRDYQRIGQHCMSGLQARTLLDEGKIGELVLIQPERDATGHMSGKTDHLNILGKDGLVVFSPTDP